VTYDERALRKERRHEEKIARKDPLERAAKIRMPGLIVRWYVRLHAVEAVPDHVEDEPTWPVSVTPAQG